MPVKKARLSWSLMPQRFHYVPFFFMNSLLLRPSLLSSRLPIPNMVETTETKSATNNKDKMHTENRSLSKRSMSVPRHTLEANTGKLSTDEGVDIGLTANIDRASRPEGRHEMSSTSFQNTALTGESVSMDHPLPNKATNSRRDKASSSSSTCRGPNNHETEYSKRNDSVSTVESTSAWPEVCHNNENPTSVEVVLVDYHANGGKSRTYTASVSTNVVEGSKSNPLFSAGKDTKGRKRSHVRRQQSEPRLNVAELVAAAKKSKSEEKEGELWKSRTAIILYTIVFLSVSLRCFIILQVIPLWTLFHFAKLLVSWFFYVRDAKEIREIYGLAKWWINFGLRFSSKTIDGQGMHRIVTAFTVKFWKGTGLTYANSIYQNISKDGREKFLRQARENLKRTQQTNNARMRNLLRNQHPSK